MGRALKQQETVRTNSIQNSVCRVNVPAVRFAALWASYPSSHPYVDPKTGEPPRGYENQCAIKVSAALHATGVEMKSFRSASVSLDGKKAAVRAEELAAWLKKQPFCGLPQQPKTITGKDWESKIKGRTGIIYFADYWARDGETTNSTGDHIDLWDGKGLTPYAANRLQRWGVNSARWLPGPLGHFNFSDQANSKEILFWEVKRIGYLFFAAIFGAIVGLLSAMLLTAFIPACGEDCSSEGLTTLMYCIAGGIVLFVGAAGFSARHAIPSAKQSAIGGLVLAAFCLLPSAGYYVLKLQSEYKTALASAPVAPNVEFPHVAIATRPVQTGSDARRGPVKPGAKINQWERCLIGMARCDAPPRQAEMWCKAGIVYVDERDWPAFSLIAKENAPGVSPLGSMRLCGE